MPNESDTCTCSIGSGRAPTKLPLLLSVLVREMTLFVSKLFARVRGVIIKTQSLRNTSMLYTAIFHSSNNEIF